MMQIISKRIIPYIISAVLFVSSVILLATIGLKPGIDFTGGSLLEVSYPDGRPATTQVEVQLANVNLGSVRLQPAGEDNLLVKLRFLSEEEHQSVLAALRSYEGTQVNVYEERFETVGPSISEFLQRKSWQVAVLVIIMIVLYIAYSFRRVSKPVQSWKYGVIAIIALVHDVTITMGIFTLLGYFLGVEVDIPFVVAMMTILGYSVNDTIVVYDRIREKLLKRKTESFEETINRGVNETIPRSVNTSITTLVVLLALFFFGGESIQYFALALAVGIVLGTYSSIFLASPLIVSWYKLGRKK